MHRNESFAIAQGGVSAWLCMSSPMARKPGPYCPVRRILAPILETWVPGTGSPTHALQSSATGARRKSEALPDGRGPYHARQC
jgi:hypothetical protein